MCLVLLSYWFSGSGQLLVGLLCAKDTLIVVNKLTSIFFFFFQAEDGIRDGHVTGVQTCALPIWPRRARGRGRPARTCRARGARSSPARGCRPLRRRRGTYSVGAPTGRSRSRRAA